MLTVPKEWMRRTFFPWFLEPSSYVMGVFSATCAFISWDGKAFPLPVNLFHEKTGILGKPPISACGWDAFWVRRLCLSAVPDAAGGDQCGVCGRGSDSLDRNSAGSPDHPFLGSPTVLLGNIKGCQTPGIYK